MGVDFFECDLCCDTKNDCSSGYLNGKRCNHIICYECIKGYNIKKKKEDNYYISKCPVCENESYSNETKVNKIIDQLEKMELFDKQKFQIVNKKKLIQKIIKIL